MILVQFVCAVVTRALFVLVSLVGVWRVTYVKNDSNYWYLTILFLPLVVEMIITLKSRKGKDCKWFSPPIFLFLISIIPSMWLLELHHWENKKLEPQFQCHKLDSWRSLKSVIMPNETVGNLTYQNYLNVLSSVCSYDWILGLHQILLILVIVGKWLLPLGGGVTRDELSERLLVFVGTAADILEFTSETLSDVKDDTPQLVYIILAVWTWSMLQFPLHLAVVKKSEHEGESRVQSLLSKQSADILSITEALFIQDGPFLVVRLTVMTYFNIYHQMLGFFAIKNLLVITLNLYRLVVIWKKCRPYSSRNVEHADPESD